MLCNCVLLEKDAHFLKRIYHINDAPLSEVDSIRDLGVTIDSELQFSTHIENITRNSFKRKSFFSSAGS